MLNTAAQNIRVLAVGDVCSQSGMEFIRGRLPAFKRLNTIDFCVVNGENSNKNGIGISPDIADDIFAYGADVITLGNHAFGEKKILSYLDESRYSRYILRPSNMGVFAPGIGFAVYDSKFGDICVINLIGRVNMSPAESPRLALESILSSDAVKSCKIKLVDFHAEATSEKMSLARLFDGKLSALWGTHTHVQTNDICIFPNGTGYITDLGMTGPIDSVIGMAVETSIERLYGDPTVSIASAGGPGKLEGAIFEINTLTGLCESCEAVRVV